MDIDRYKNGSVAEWNITAKGNNYLFGDITLDHANILMVAIPNDAGWHIKVNGEEVNAISVNGGFLGILLESGYNTIEMSYVTPGLKTGILMSGIGVLFFALNIL